MLSRSSLSICLVALTTLFQSIHAHTILTYPGWRGDNLNSNGTSELTNGIGEYTSADGENYFPYGMQWAYPCGGMPITQNRTKWPLKGGAVAFQPGWFQGHKSAYIYINLGLGTYPLNHSISMLKDINLLGPQADPYPGTYCFPQVAVPATVNAKVGDNATIQLIETALHGASLYNCVDITFAEPEDVPEVNETNCFNSSHISANLIFTTAALENAGIMSVPSASYGVVSTAMALVFAFFLI